MRVVIAGSAGIPGDGGRLELAAERLAERLVARGHRVVVTAAQGGPSAGLRGFKGARLVHLPAAGDGPAARATHAVAAAAYATHVLRPDVVLALVDADAPGWPRSHRRDVGLVLHVVGSDVLARWDGGARDAAHADDLSQAAGTLARAARAAVPPRRAAHGQSPARALRAEARAIRMADAVVTQSSSVAATLSRRHGCDVAVVRHGVEDPGFVGRQTLTRLRLVPRRYVLALSAPEAPVADGALVRAFRAMRSGGDEPPRIVLADADPALDAVAAQELQRADHRVLVPGRLSEAGRWQLMRHAAVVALPPSVSGPHPLVLDALASGACLLAEPTPPTLEIADGAVAWRAPAGDDRALTRQLEELLSTPERQEEHRRRARAHARRFDWDAVAGEHERILAAAVRARGFGALPAELRDPPAVPPRLEGDPLRHSPEPVPARR